jgi:hypothetical protein
MHEKQFDRNNSHVKSKMLYEVAEVVDGVL